jgi:23S rRNA (pseudouridine1915-N3)-methyltransferase
MLFRFVWIGKTRNAQLKGLIDDYLGRLSRFVRCEIAELREANVGDPKSGIEEEGKRILSALRSDSLKILLDVKGKEQTSYEIAHEIERWQNAGQREVAFVIGGFGGFSDPVARAADLKWSLSRLTFTHEMARVLLLEQLYRGYTIVNRLPYQK